MSCLAWSSIEAVTLGMDRWLAPLVATVLPRRLQTRLLLVAEKATG